MSRHAIHSRRTNREMLDFVLHMEPIRDNIGAQPSDATCKCGKVLSLAEVSCYGKKCEECYVGNTPSTGRSYGQRVTPLG